MLDTREVAHMIASANTLSRFYEERFKPIRFVGLKHSTKVQYQVTINHWNRFSAAKPLPSIDSLAIANFQNHLLNWGEAAPSVNKYLRHLKSLLNFAKSEHQISEMPLVRKIKEAKKAPVAYTKDEFKKVMVVACIQSGEICNVPAYLWWCSLLIVNWETGARIGALLAVDTSDLLFDHRGCFIRADDNKPKEDQFFRLSDRVLDFLRRIYDPRRKKLWPWEMTRETLYRHFRSKILDKTNVPTWKGTGSLFHRIRKSTASYTRLNGGNATLQLGHSSPAVTERYYDPRICGVQDVTKYMPNIDLPGID